MKYREQVANAKAAPNNSYATPDAVMDVIAPYLAPFPRVWEPCVGLGHIRRYLEAKGHAVHGTDITMGAEFDVHVHALPPTEYDIIVTNPPYTGKSKFFGRMFELDKPFAIIVPTMALESPIVRQLLRVHDGHWGILMPAKTHAFIPIAHPEAATLTAPPKNSRSFFHSSWFTYKVPGIRGVVIQSR